MLPVKVRAKVVTAAHDKTRVQVLQPHYQLLRFLQTQTSRRTLVWSQTRSNTTVNNIKPYCRL